MLLLAEAWLQVPANEVDLESMLGRHPSEVWDPSTPVHVAAEQHWRRVDIGIGLPIDMKNGKDLHILWKDVSEFNFYIDAPTSHEFGSKGLNLAEKALLSHRRQYMFTKLLRNSRACFLSNVRKRETICGLRTYLHHSNRGE
jgi:hypothetical protein